jgi:hypothetical protein
MIGRRIQCFWCEQTGETDDGMNPTYRRTDTGETFVLGQAPVGAMYFADWLHGRGPDGHCLIVVTPHGPWNVDGGFQWPSAGKWTRTGEPPRVTARPSIGQGGKGPNGGPPWSYHAFLTDGALEDCE